MMVRPRQPGAVRLLIVEDAPHVIDELRDRFGGPEFECEVALDLRTADAILAERRMDAIVVDATARPMLRGGVPALIRRLKSADPAMQVVIFNGVVGKATQRRMRRLGAVGYLSRKSNLNALERSVCRILGREQVATRMRRGVSLSGAEPERTPPPVGN